MIKKLKMKFKRALFAFFKEEILSIVKFNPKASDVLIVPPPPIDRHFNGTTIFADILLNDRRDYDDRIKSPAEHYENALEKARKALFKEFIKYIKVDDYNIVDPQIYGARKITLAIKVQKPS